MPGQGCDNAFENSPYKFKSLKDTVAALIANATRIPVKVTPTKAIRIDIILEGRRSGRKSP